MNTQLAAFGFGCLLLLVAVIGGGFEVKELKVPKVGRGSRLAACLFGALFIFVGIRPDFAAELGPHKSPAVSEPPAGASQAQQQTEGTAQAQRTEPPSRTDAMSHTRTETSQQPQVRDETSKRPRAGGSTGKRQPQQTGACRGKSGKRQSLGKRALKAYKVIRGRC